MVMEEDGFAQRFQVMEDWSKIVSQNMKQKDGMFTFKKMLIFRDVMVEFAIAMTGTVVILDTKV